MASTSQHFDSARLATEIVTGNMPDIVCLDGLSSRSLETSGYLENLWPYIDEDPALGRENLMLRPLQAQYMLHYF